MNPISIYQVDAFTDSLFSGNPAAVCFLDTWLPDELMQSIAAENNLAETAFLVPYQRGFHIRWFTPTVEVDLCGHATLASAFVLFNLIGHPNPVIEFKSPRSGILKVSREKDIMFLDFPTDTIERIESPENFYFGEPNRVLELYKGKTDYIAVFGKEEDIRNFQPDFREIGLLEARGLIITAKGKKADFVSRFFGPQSGILEDPVTGSAHTSLIPLWASKLGKTELSALQLSKRGGKLDCVYKTDRCLIGGKAKLFFSGEIYLG